MTENDARHALLVRAFETTASPQPPWGDDDRDWATRAAAEVEGERASADAFVARRARLAAERLSTRDARVRRTLRALAWRPWVGWALALVAFGLGAASDAIGARHRINVLAPPQLALIAWNLAVYALIASRALASLAGSAPRQPGALTALLARAAHAAGLRPETAGDSSPLARFAADWARASAKLNAARVARVLHVGAIAFALGALAGLYVRGLGLEFRAGWESTFLGAPAVQAILELALGPASWLTGIALPDTARLEAMRYPESAGEPAAPWIHLYAVTVGLAVVLPRLLLAVVDRLREHRIATRFPLSLDDAYFGALVRSHRGEAVSAVAVPHVQAPSAQAVLGLRSMLAAVMGPKTQLAVRPPVAYGDEEEAAGSLAPAASPRTATAPAPGPAPTLVVALMSSTATPEPQAQGAFVDALSAALPPDASLLVLVDESAFAARFGEADPAAARRRTERRSAWTRFLASHGRRPLFVDLERDDPGLAARALREALDRPAGATPEQAAR
jgi:hypothetical protein